MTKPLPVCVSGFSLRVVSSAPQRMTNRIVTIPNILTLGRLIAVPVFIVASFGGHFMFAFVLFVVAALTDIVDGFIARRLNQRSKLGALLDPAADKIMMVAGFLF